MTILPGLTSTEADRIPAFVDALRRSDVRAIALFPTVLDPAERNELYRDLAAIPGLTIPHVHLRTDFTLEEIRFVAEKFSTELFNIHPQKSRHPFGEVPSEYVPRVYVENVEIPPEDDELASFAGLCPDYSHLESARVMGATEYVATVERQLERFPIGCCHVAGIRPGEPNAWNGGPDHHNFRSLSDLDYMARYADVLPDRWISLELENPFDDQMEAARYLRRLLGVGTDATRRGTLTP
ncbi:MAG: hypothetical protein ACOC7V_05425 [Spirochaetota bacterium]